MDWLGLRAVEYSAVGHMLTCNSPPAYPGTSCRRDFDADLVSLALRYLDVYYRVVSEDSDANQQPIISTAPNGLIRRANGI